MILGLLLAFRWQSACADVVFIGSTAAPSTEEADVQMAADFYGLTLDIFRPKPDSDDRAIADALGRRETVGAVIAANALPLVNKEALIRAMLRGPGGTLPVLILGVTPETDATLITTWSGGAVNGSGQRKPSHASTYLFGQVEWAAQLSHLQVSSPRNAAAYFTLRKNSNAHPIMSIRDEDQFHPVFIETELRGLQVFLASAILPSSPNPDDSPDQLVHAFVQIAPVMMFIRYCAGERGWHFPNHYANLTIDDPWLREPYGHFSYPGLLTEMEKHNFHSTVAFIPWNYDRSQPRVASLIRAHRDRFSICIHGNNHDHKEFTDYQSKFFSGQIDAIKQSLARMDEFRRRTRIPYEKVMVFPHSIAPERTLVVLKTYNFLGTVNSTDVPMDRAKPPLLPFSLRPVTMSFGNFTSLRRNSAQIPISNNFVAINAFLGNPMLFYCHQDFFAGGIDQFDKVADQVNNIQPGTQWRSVGDIIRHLYLTKRRDDFGYDVLSFSSTFLLTNTSGHTSVFYIRKEEKDSPPIKSVSVDGRLVPYALREGYLNLSAAVPAGETRNIIIQYGNDLHVASSIDISKKSSRVYFLRMGSDFRDLVLSRTVAGQTIIRLYTEHQLTPGKLLLGVGIALLVGICVGIGAWTMCCKSYAVRRAARSI
jgi:hypothetical protein